MENKELLELLQAAALVKSVSTRSITFPRSAIEELKAPAAPEESTADEAEPAEVAEAPSKGPVLPEGVIVKSAEDLVREKQAAEAALEAEKASAIAAAKQAQAEKIALAQAAAAPKTPPAPATPPPAAPPRAVPPRAVPPVAKPPVAGPPPAAPKSPLSGKPPVAPPPVAVPPKVPTTPAPRAAPAATPPVPPAANRPPVPAGPPVPPPAGPPKPPVTTPPIPAPQAADAASESAAETEAQPSVELQTIHLKPPIVVRDFAGEIGLKPFKLISELMEMGIFASMNQTIEKVQLRLWQTPRLCEIHHRGEDQKPAKKVVEKIDDDDQKFLKPRHQSSVSSVMWIPVRPPFWIPFARPM